MTFDIFSPLLCLLFISECLITNLVSHCRLSDTFSKWAILVLAVSGNSFRHLLKDWHRLLLTKVTLIPSRIKSRLAIYIYFLPCTQRTVGSYQIQHIKSFAEIFANSLKTGHFYFRKVYFFH